MNRSLRNILIAAVVAVGGATAAGQDSGVPDISLRRLARGSVTRQKLLKLRLERIAKGTLTACLDHNRAVWKSLTPEKRERFRNEALAFLKKNPADQAELLKRYEEFTAISPAKQARYRRTARWIEAVVATLSPEKRKELLSMPPAERARFLRARRDELVQAGKLVLEAEPPATQPAAAPTTQPSDLPSGPDTQ